MFIHRIIKLEELIYAHWLGPGIGGIGEKAVALSNSTIELFFENAIQTYQIHLEGLQEHG